jgi:hypothetical protein
MLRNMVYRASRYTRMQDHILLVNENRPEHQGRTSIKLYLNIPAGTDN